ncbi:MAG: sulfotransferase domain-containing protein [Planctomycetota bacterium]
MLLIFNGAPKGGSTWLLQIVTSLGIHARIPKGYQQEGWANSSLADDRVQPFLNEVDIETGQYCCKQHWFGEQWHRELLEIPHVRVLNIIRDLRDVVVSRYFHDMRLGIVEDGVSIEHYWGHHNGRGRAKRYIDYHLFWHDHERDREPWLASYERLHDDFYAEVQALLKHIGLDDLGDEAIHRAHRATSLANRPSESGDGKFFRKGIVGDWKNHLPAWIVDELDGMIEETGYSRLLAKIGSRT